MTIDSKKRKQLLALFLSAMMASSFTALAACDDEDTDNTTDTETEDTSSEKDTARLTNGSFEFYDDNDGKNLIITSPGNWSRSNASGGVTSKAASGIINTEESAWKNLTTSSNLSYATVEDAKKNWDNLTAKDKLAFYEAQKDEDELDFYEKFNIDQEDLPTCANPGTHYAEDDAKAADNTNVLMIHNDYNVSGKYGTAQKFASSTTITLAAGTYAELSVWVKTSDLKYSTKEQDVLESRGAYIDITQTVGSTTLDTLQVKNINTEIQANQSENNGWVNYKFYVQSCSYSSSTIKITLGLGQATVSTNTSEYVGGYAFFDDVTCKIYDAQNWDTAISTVNTNLNMASSKEAKIINADVNTDLVFSMDMDSHNTGFNEFNYVANATTELTTEEAGNGKVYASAGANKFVGLTIDNTNDFTGSTTFAELQTTTNTLLTKVNANITKPESFESDVIYVIASSEGAAYTTTVRPNNSYYELGAGEYAVYSFFLKTSDLAGHTGAGVKFVEMANFGTDTAPNFKAFGNEAVISSVDTSSITGVDVTIDTANGEDKREDIYEGWQQCFFFLENDTEETKYFQIEFTYGTTAIVNSKDSDYYGGFAAIANFQTRTLASEEFDFISAGTYSKTFSLTGYEKQETSGQVFDNASSVGGDINKGLANPLTYKGVYGGSGYVNGTSTDTRLNENQYAGLINKKAFNDTDPTTEEGWVDNAVNNKIKEELNANGFTLGNSTQPLVIYNETEQAYGFIGGGKSISASTHSAVSVRVKASAGAIVNIYLVDTSDSTHESILTLNTGVTYWYNDDGDLCAKDPSDHDFNKKTDVAFTLQDNGLYLVNEKWSGYAASGVAKNQYYANLANYEGYGEGDLLVAENGVSYNYNDKWSNQGNDGVAFYYNDGKYYAYENYTTEVKDFSEVQGLTARTEAQDAKELKATITGSGDDLWTTVTFYIHTGSNAKSYRLEVWSGSRDGVTKNAADSLVLVDLGGANALTDDSFSSILDKVKENVEDIPGCTGESFESGFSFYDSNTFLRYDASLDENEVGNSYESYVSSAYSVGTAYMNYYDENNLTNMIFVDYALSEATVTPDLDEEDEEETEEETTTDSETNVLLLASSIAIAVFLLFAVVSIIVRKFVMQARKNKGYTVTVQSVAPARKAKKEVDEENKN